MSWPTVTVFARGTNGAPSTSVLRVLEGITSYEHSIAVNIGFESLRITFGATKADALFWLNALMSACVATGPDAETIWEGYLETVDVQIGGLVQTLTVQGMANRVRVRYTTTTGVAGVTAVGEDTTSQGIYGIKEAVVSVGATTATEAANVRDTYLNTYKYPIASARSAVATGATGAESTVTLTFAGWGTTLDWRVTSQTDTSTQDSGTQIAAFMSGGFGLGISTSTANIGTTGRSVTRFIAPDTTYRTKIDDLTSKGNSASARLVWGVYDERVFALATWAGAVTATTATTYWVSQTARAIYDGQWGTVQPWNVRPNALAGMIELYDPAPNIATADATNRFFVERVTCSVGAGGWAVTLEPATTTGVDVLLARIGG